MERFSVESYVFNLEELKISSGFNSTSPVSMTFGRHVFRLQKPTIFFTHFEKIL